MQAPKQRTTHEHTMDINTLPLEIVSIILTFAAKDNPLFLYTIAIRVCTTWKNLAVTLGNKADALHTAQHHSGPWVQRLAPLFHFTAEDIRSKDNLMLRASCASGDLPTTQWLVSTFKLTHIDARSKQYAAFRAACRNGHIQTAKWLKTTFNMTPKEIAIKSDDTCKSCITNGHPAVAEWLITIIMPPDFIRHNNLEYDVFIIDSLYWSLRSYHFFSAKRLLDHYSIQKQECTGLLASICAARNDRACRWLIEQFGFTPTDLKNTYESYESDKAWMHEMCMMSTQQSPKEDAICTTK